MPFDVLERLEYAVEHWDLMAGQRELLRLARDEVTRLRNRVATLESERKGWKDLKIATHHEGDKDA
jgi:BMFP domain-containing protein YqiC